ncbi:MAG: polysaccharide lyase family 7 protein, partial [Pseudomonadota bacterium]|nr:polysaccharide lyase family 7 protein [Pseudomonadota bacterium]
GIALNEPFSYTIEVLGNTLFVTISREGKADVVSTYDMTGSRYDEADQYMYFKVGVYHVNNSSNADERAKVTFYSIKNSHDNYAESE